jgi:hypothetical protein
MDSDDDLLVGVPDGDDAMVTADDEALFAGQTPQAAADDTVEMEEEAARAAARQRQLQHERDEETAADAEAEAEPTAPKGRFSGKRKIIEHGWSADPMEAGRVDLTSAAEQAKIAARAAKFGTEAPAPLPTIEPAELLTMEEIAARQARAAKFGVETNDPLATLDRAAGSNAYWEKRRDAADDEEARPEAVHIFGTDKM